ncbi:site-specific integrase [Anaerovorax odorimutans]|uniref:Site-specific integrase n=1 Tax=Anaerovorax odorimutans TaxID=109327 RepID=A0ABT1RPQ1_9FIRM|nr:site-specific integrase [Anaerovorax odorimutans]MCQ4637175.1 site-specific integrase [Anaerovorax odorimutans]
MAGKTNCTINGKDYFRIRRKVGKKLNKHGEWVDDIKSFYGTSKKAAEKQYEIWKEEQKNKSKKKDGRAPFGDFAKFFAEQVFAVDTSYSEGTVKLYTSAYKNHIAKDFKLCGMILADMTAEDIQLFYNRLTCTQSAMKSVNKFMVLLFKYLSRAGYCQNLMAGIVIPTKEAKKIQDGTRKTVPATELASLKEEVEIWEDWELETIMEHIEGYRLRFFIILCVATGLRISEEFAIKYSDFRDGQLYIDRQYKYGKLIPPKHDSYRSIPIHPMVARELELHREWHEREMERNKYKTDFVFTTKTGSLLEYQNARRSLQRFYNRITDEKGKQLITPKKFHAYRATFGTNLCRQGVRIEVVSKLMGHKSVEVTQKYYININTEDRQGAVETLPDYTKNLATF